MIKRFGLLFLVVIGLVFEGVISAWRLITESVISAWSLVTENWGFFVGMSAFVLFLYLVMRIAARQVVRDVKEFKRDTSRRK